MGNTQHNKKRKKASAISGVTFSSFVIFLIFKTATLTIFYAFSKQNTVLKYKLSN
jgi:hypothetical protein